MSARRNGSFLSLSGTFSRGSMSLPSAPSMSSPEEVKAIPVPSFNSLNPYAHHGSAAATEQGARWKPVQGLVHSKESLALRQSIGEILKTVHEHISPATLEIRASTPEYRLENDDWIAHSNSLDKGTIKAVARLPMDLLMIDETSATSSEAPLLSVGGWLRKRGETNKSLKRRYMELENRSLCYYKKKPEKNGVSLSPAEKESLMKGKIDLEAVSSIQPTVIKGAAVTWGIDLVTTNRTWMIQAENESDYDMWVKFLCNSVPFHSVNIVYRRMLQLAEVSASGPNEVRMVLLPSSSVEDTVAHVFECYDNMYNAVPLHPYDPKQYVLKFTGFRDYMIDRHQELGKYQHVRECLLTRKTLCLTLVHESAIEEATRLSTSAPPSYQGYLIDSLSARTLDMAITTLGTDWHAPASSPNKPANYGQSGALTTASLSFSILRVLNIPRYTVCWKRSAHDVSVERRPLTCQTAFVRVELYDGGQLLEVVGDTAEVALKAVPGTDTLAAIWTEPTLYQSSMCVSEAPRSTRIVITLMGSRQDEHILTAGINVFDVEGLLEQGDQYVQMWDSLHHSRHGPVPHVVFPDQPLAHFVLHSFGKNVKFDWTNQPTPPALRNESVVKEGWLKKTGKFHTFTNWQPRWCVLSQLYGSLYYSDGPNAPHKGAISLVGAVVTAADELNAKYTTFAVNKGTRKEQSTWVFKVKSAESSREYVMCAATRQEREEWMLAIKVVANGNASESIAELRSVITRDPLFQLSEFQKAIMWRHRLQFVDSFEALRHVLSCVNWRSAVEVNEMLELLPQWAKPRHPAAYIDLLDKQFSHERVREFAVCRLGEMADSTFSYFLPQLVQALKYENHHVSHLAKLLMRRAIENPNQIGFDLFWGMKVESYNNQYRERYGLLLNAYVDVCSQKMRVILELQDKLFSEKGEFEQICQQVKAWAHQGKTKDELKTLLREKLAILNQSLPSSYQLPLDPRVEVGKMVVKKCKIMTSAKLPLWLEFENAEEGGDPIVIIFKAGDDVRQDCLTLQLIRLMDEMWREDGKDLAMEPYKCVSTGPMTGMLQVVLHAVTTAAVHKRGGALGGIFGAFNDVSFSDWIAANNGDPRSHRVAVDLFLRSCAGYCVATYMLGIGDRHNDNIMITKQGRYFHIDFGHFLGFMKYQYGIKREQTPFVFTPEMAHVFGGVGTEDFTKFQATCGEAFNVVRRHLHLLVSLLVLMIPADMPELRNRDDISYIVEVSAIERSDEDAARGFAGLIVSCMNNTFKRIDNALHIIKHR
ncbi:Aste57867_8208 [Aphanomyces stellatus]|uniref:phosphatidylinositol 3-kinase n=1 Tax=Aphanomyces stellatus TaxID=120398 RepID=A0A485KJP8_9STRA|nr:hypothetical protein As57867_008177 [Aphanomyces stellatus]VFT85095.1 Aste57867_8208 [Aphanomyces stellatus]